MAEPVLQVNGVTKMFGGFTALDKVSLHLNPGERLGLIGPNGSGKTTMINCISGALANEEGDILFDVTEWRYGYGGGVLWFSPFGPLQLVLGFPIDPRADENSPVVEFSVGGLGI